MNGIKKQPESPSRYRGTSPMVVASGSPTSSLQHRERSAKGLTSPTSPNYASEAETEILGLTPEKKRQRHKEDETRTEQGASKKKATEEIVKKESTVRERSEKPLTAQSDGEASSSRPGTIFQVSDRVNNATSVPPSPSRRHKTPQLDRSASGDESISSSTKSADRNPDGSKKRKHGYERNSSGEPPRQKHKLDQARSEGPPPSDARRTSLPMVLKIHKRASSVRSDSQDGQSQTCSGVLSGQAQKGWEDHATIALAQTEDAWSSDSSDQSLHHTKVSTKQSSTRSRVSPVRTMPQIKKRVDRFGVSIFARHCEKGDIEAAKQALEQSPDDIDEPDYAKNTPLQKASLEGHVNVVKFLINTGRCNINNANTSQDTPLIDAVENGHLEVVKLLLAGGADPHLQNKAGSKPYDVIDDQDEHSDEIIAALREAMQKDSTQRKSDAGLDLGSTRSESQQNSPALPRDPSIGSLGFGRHAKLPNSILHMESTVESLRSKTSEGDQVAVYELLIRHVKPDNACGVAAARGGHEFILNLFIDKGLDMDPDPVKHDYETPMLVAIGRGHLNIVDLLLKQDRFNPTRRTRRGRAYYELAEERRGPNWQKERDMLKEAFDRYVQRREKAMSKKKDGSPRSNEKDKVKRSPHREKSLSKGKAQPSVITNSHTSSVDHVANAAESGTVKSEPNEAPQRVSDIVPKKLKRRGSEPGSLTEPAERRRKLVQAKDLQRLDRSQQKINGQSDFGEEEREAILSRASESPRLSEHASFSQKQKLKAKGRRLSIHDSDKRSSEVISRPSSVLPKEQKTKMNAQSISARKDDLNKTISFEPRAKSAEKLNMLGKSRGSEAERSPKHQLKKEAREEDKGLKAHQATADKKQRSSIEVVQGKQDLALKRVAESNRDDKKHARKSNSVKQSPGKETTERKRNDKEVSEGDGKRKNDKETRNARSEQPIKNSEKSNNGEGRGNEELRRKNSLMKDNIGTKTREAEGERKQGTERNIAEKDLVVKGNNEVERADAALTKEERVDRVRKDPSDKQRAEKDRREKERIAEEQAEKERQEKERAEKECQEKERVEKERAEKERVEKERAEKERAEKERLERERIEKEQLEQERLENERRKKDLLEQKRLEKERLEKERIENERIDRERLEKDRQEKERVEKERIEEARLEKERLERERVERERQEQEKREKERIEVERLEKLENERKAHERQQYLATLPLSLRQAFTVGSKLPIRSKDGKLCISRNFLPLYVVRQVEIDPSCLPEERQDPWILNFQAAAILGQHDMDLNQYSTWRRYPTTYDQRRFFLQGYDVADIALLQRHPPHSAAPHDPGALIQAIEEAKALFMTMQPLFWISLADFMKAVPQYSHLKDVKMPTLAICHVDYAEDPEFGLSRLEVLEFKRDNSRHDIIRRVLSQNLKPLTYVNGMPEQVNGLL